MRKLLEWFWGMTVVLLYWQLWVLHKQESALSDSKVELMANFQFFFDVIDWSWSGSRPHEKHWWQYIIACMTFTICQNKEVQYMRFTSYDSSHDAIYYYFPTFFFWFYNKKKERRRRRGRLFYLLEWRIATFYLYIQAGNY